MNTALPPSSLSCSLLEQKADKGKLKKWKKRVEQGEIQDTALFRMSHGQYHLSAIPSVSLAADCGPEVDVKHIRDLLYTLLIQDRENQRSRVFEWKNRGYIRRVLILFSDETDTDTEIERGAETMRDTERANTTSVFLSLRLKAGRSLAHQLLSSPPSLSQSKQKEIERDREKETERGTERLFSESLFKVRERLMKIRATPEEVRRADFPLREVPTEREVEAWKEERDRKRQRTERTETKRETERYILEEEYTESDLCPLALSLSVAKTFLSWVYRLQYIETERDTEREIETEILYDSFLSPLKRETLLQLRERLAEVYPEMRESHRFPLLSVAAIDCEMLETEKRQREVVRCALLGLRDRDRETEAEVDGEDDKNDTGIQIVRVWDVISVPLSPLSEVVSDQAQFTGLSLSSLSLLKERGIAWHPLCLKCALLLSLSAETIVIGHSLESDLSALRLCLSLSLPLSRSLSGSHRETEDTEGDNVRERKRPREETKTETNTTAEESLSPIIVDSALLFKHPQGWPKRFRLRDLFTKHLLHRLPDSFALLTPSGELISLSLSPSESLSPHSPSQDALWSLLLSLFYASTSVSEEDRQREDVLLSLSQRQNPELQWRKQTKTVMEREEDVHKEIRDWIEELETERDRRDGMSVLSLSVSSLSPFSLSSISSSNFSSPSISGKTLVVKVQRETETRANCCLEIV